MYPYVKCPTCNNLLGHIFQAFRAMRALKNEQKQDGLLDIFELLSIRSYCCKTRLMAVREFNEFLHAN